MTLKRVYKVKRSPYIYFQELFPLFDVGYYNHHSPCWHNVLVVSHGIAGQINSHTGIEDQV